MKVNMNRRRFLESALAGFSVLGTSGCASIFGREKIRLGVIGMMGKGFTDWLPMVRSGLAEVVAFCDADAEQRFVCAKMTASHYEAEGARIDVLKVPFYTDYRRLLDDAGILGLDAVTVSTPDHMHAAIAIRAMQMGLHVYVQKPLVRTLGELAKFNQVARDRGVVMQMANQGSAGDGFRRNVEIVRSGILGEVREVHVWTNRPVWPQGFVARDAATTRQIVQPPMGLNWNVWLGVAKDRPYRADYAVGTNEARYARGVYHRFNWRGFYDFGCGAFGDMACHTMNLPFRGLELGSVVRVEASDRTEVNDVAFPMRSTVKLTYAARPSKARPGVELPSVDLYWYDGDQQRDGDRRLAALMPQVTALEKFKGRVPRTGCLIVGSKGILCSCADYGQEAYFAFKDEKVARDTREHEACRVVAQSIPRREDIASGGMTEGSSASGAAALEAPGHYVEFLDAIRGEGPVYAETQSRCYSDVEFSIPMMEGILVGVTAQRIGGALAWDSVRQQFDNALANQLIQPSIRPGFEF